ncbi:MAG: hypothetical protein WAT39_22530, partial [Planctomycetota bacterium]
VLPFAGPAAPALRDSARQLLHSRLRALGYQVPELAWVDRVASERGWLSDPERFDPSPVPLAEVVAALGVDAVLVGTGIDETSFNIVLLRRHALGGSFALRDATGREPWSARHAAGSWGGFLLASGQVITELRAQADHGTPMASLALADELVADVAGTLPAATMPAQPPGPFVTDVTVTLERQHDGADRFVIEAQASAGATVRCDLLPHTMGVPMVPAPSATDQYRGRLDVQPDAPVTRIVVRARDAFGREASAEVKR